MRITQSPPYVTWRFRWCNETRRTKLVAATRCVQSPTTSNVPETRSTTGTTAMAQSETPINLKMERAFQPGEERHVDKGNTPCSLSHARRPKKYVKASITTRVPRRTRNIASGNRGNSSRVRSSRMSNIENTSYSSLLTLAFSRGADSTSRPGTRHATESSVSASCCVASPPWKSAIFSKVEPERRSAHKRPPSRGASLAGACGSNVRSLVAAQSRSCVVVWSSVCGALVDVDVVCWLISIAASAAVIGLVVRQEAADVEVVVTWRGHVRQVERTQSGDLRPPSFATPKPRLVRFHRARPSFACRCTLDEAGVPWKLSVRSKVGRTKCVACGRRGGVSGVLWDMMNVAPDNLLAERKIRLRVQNACMPQSVQPPRPGDLQPADGAQYQPASEFPDVFLRALDSDSFFCGVAS